MIETAEQFVHLRASDDPQNYRRAAHEEATEEVWLDVIQRYPAMREWVAHNKTVSLKILRVLAKDVDPRVRFAVAAKRELDGELFVALSEDDDDSVRHRLACNARCPLDILKRLSEDKVEFVAMEASERL